VRVTVDREWANAPVKLNENFLNSRARAGGEQEMPVHLRELNRMGNQIESHGSNNKKTGKFGRGIKG